MADREHLQVINIFQPFQRDWNCTLQLELKLKKNTCLWIVDLTSSIRGQNAMSRTDSSASVFLSWRASFHRWIFQSQSQLAFWCITSRDARRVWVFFRNRSSRVDHRPSSKEPQCWSCLEPSLHGTSPAGWPLSLSLSFLRRPSSRSLKSWNWSKLKHNFESSSHGVVSTWLPGVKLTSRRGSFGEILKSDCLPVSENPVVRSIIKLIRSRARQIIPPRGTKRTTSSFVLRHNLVVEKNSRASANFAVKSPRIRNIYFLGRNSDFEGVGIFVY